ncbi:hypothetical protein PYCCODRAFT_650177 [Trametes coccinea BRFM310]|uniref:Uncharacterized protein n=1 Tax=Trametes coccinea (strain BRFM310) TaxID=1353009 RepID=A0A1Y2IIB7_TRAC3|nr:hypothetical protein PYCCODRAFT_650177 [Trametes coccinea BRFM310]
MDERDAARGCRLTPLETYWAFMSHRRAGVASCDGRGSRLTSTFSACLSACRCLGALPQRWAAIALRQLAGEWAALTPSSGAANCMTRSQLCRSQCAFDRFIRASPTEKVKRRGRLPSPMPFRGPTARSRRDSPWHFAGILQGPSPASDRLLPPQLPFPAILRLLWHASTVVAPIRSLVQWLWTHESCASPNAFPGGARS